MWAVVRVGARRHAVRDPRFRCGITVVWGSACLRWTSRPGGARLRRGASVTCVAVCQCSTRCHCGASFVLVARFRCRAAWAARRPVGVSVGLVARCQCSFALVQLVVVARPSVGCLYSLWFSVTRFRAAYPPRATRRTGGETSWRSVFTWTSKLGWLCGAGLAGWAGSEYMILYCLNNNN